MTILIIEASKYILMFFYLIYILGAFLRFSGGSQKVLIYLIHALGFTNLYLNNPNVKIIGFYLMQVIAISSLFLLFRIIYPKSNKELLNHIGLLLVTGFIILTRISFEKSFRQFLFVLAGMVCMLILPAFLKKGAIFRKFTWVYYVIGVVMLGLVVLIGSTSYGAKLELSIGSLSFQPSEFVKIIYVFFMASMLYKTTSVKQIIKTVALSGVFILLLVASKDLGSALIYTMALMIVVYVSSAKVRYLFLGTGLMAVASIVGYFAFSHVRTRVFAWLKPLDDIENKGYQICQSLFGIGTGGWFGMGIGQGIPSKIPVVEKDFVFSAIVEEQGAIVGICIILLCFSTFWLLLRLAIGMKDEFYKLVSLGLATIYVTQVFLTIGGAIKFIPSTGVTLPLVSYGGSSMVSTLILFGIIQGLSMGKIIKEEKRKTKAYYGIFYIFLASFLAMVGYLSYFVGFKSKEFTNNEYNTLWMAYEKEINRGSILTSDGNVMAKTSYENGKMIRIYPYENLYSHWTGYSDRGKVSLEKKFNFELLQSDLPELDQIISKLFGDKVQGNQVVTTVDTKLQQIAYDALGDYKGAVVVMEASTGKVLAMISKPDYDPNQINEDWEEIHNGDGLFNRVTQGLYTPGSTFKLYTLLAYIRSNENSYQDYSYVCTGSIVVGDKIIHCAGNKAHGIVDLETSFALSCNTSFVNMMQYVDIEILQKTCQELLFQQTLTTDFESNQGKFSLSKDDAIGVIADTAFGQGKTLVTPLQMVTLMAAIANEGQGVSPMFIQGIETSKGNVVERYESQLLDIDLSQEEVKILQNYLRKAIEIGPSGNWKGVNYDIYGKTGTAQITSDLYKTNAWFIGFASLEGYENIAIAVVVEESGSGANFAAPIARKIFDAYFNEKFALE